MADICVIFGSEDEDVVRKLVSLLSQRWDVWWAEDIVQGDWEKAIRAEIRKAYGVLPVLSRHTEGKNVFRDELKYAEKQGRLIFPFFIDQTEPPLGFGHLNRTDAFGWEGEANHPGYQQLIRKIAVGLRAQGHGDKFLKRRSTLQLRGKTLQLPCFVFSLSSHETRVPPKEGVKLLQLLEPAAGLVSAYDAWKYRSDRAFLSGVAKLRQSSCALFLDSGNYEAFRKKDHYSRENRDGWRRDFFRQMASDISPDIAFAFDHPTPRGLVDEVAERIVANFRADERAIHPLTFPLCPIIHIPRKHEGTPAECASRIVAKIALAIDPIMVAIPERELGDGLLERFRAVRDIRKALDDHGTYYPLHLLGTGNPISMIALAAAGADSFDGLEWCRTVADFDNGNLFHFQHLDCFRERYFGRLQSRIRRIIEDPEAMYAARVASYNFDFFTQWTRTMHSMIHSGQVEHLLKMVPNIATTLFKELPK